VFCIWRVRSGAVAVAWRTSVGINRWYGSCISGRGHRSVTVSSSFPAAVLPHMPGTTASPRRGHHQPWCPLLTAAAAASVVAAPPFTGPSSRSKSDPGGARQEMPGHGHPVSRFVYHDRCHAFDHMASRMVRSDQRWVTECRRERVDVAAVGLVGWHPPQYPDRTLRHVNSSAQSACAKVCPHRVCTPATNHERHPCGTLAL
jgi:hypothetical protein